MKKTQPLLRRKWSFGFQHEQNCYSGVEADNATTESLAASHSGDFGIFGKNRFIKISLF